MPVSKFRAKKWIISELDLQKAEEVLLRTKPPVTHDEAVAFYIELWDQFAETMEKYRYAAKKLPHLENQVKYWKNKALKAKPRLTPIKYE